MSSPRLIAGFDPGLGRTGYAIIEQNGSSVQAVTYGVFATTVGASVPTRLLELRSQVAELFRRYQPACIGIERLAVGRSTPTVLDVAQARGVLLVEATATGANLVELTATQVKVGVSGYGKAEKGQLNRLLKTQLGITGTITPDDASDALAIAVAASAYAGQK